MGLSDWLREVCDYVFFVDDFGVFGLYYFVSWDKDVMVFCLGLGEGFGDGLDVMYCDVVMGWLHGYYFFCKGRVKSCKFVIWDYVSI